MMKFSLRIILIFNVWRLCPAVQLLPSMGYFIVIQQLECVVNSEYISKVSCDVNTPRNRSVDAELVLMQNLKVLMGTIKVSIPDPKKKIFQKIFDITFELCNVFRERKKKTLIDILSRMAQLENKTLQCPLVKGHYRVRNSSIVESLPPVLKESPFILNLNWFMPPADHVMNITVLGRLFDIGKEQKN
ncbi:uncharacterized protein LOC117783737 [Drosophila innubila]|uniref:uncharacterized protein LOC117783737 n=1 Tax=Drosophila innubila TaxID=198719 RepID=UPI00148E4B52|nr:uncharacterized protein LOC117783737 [Drosophila innubila]